MGIRERALRFLNTSRLSVEAPRRLSYDIRPSECVHYVPSEPVWLDQPQVGGPTVSVRCLGLLDIALVLGQSSPPQDVGRSPET